MFAVLLVPALAAAQERPANYARAPRFKALVYYTEHAEEPALPGRSRPGQSGANWG